MRDVPNRLREARIPAFVAKTTLPQMGQDGLRELVQSKQYQTATEGLRSYRVIGEFPRQLADVTAVLAKELLLSGVPVRYAPAIALCVFSEFHERHGERSEEDYIHGGSGYLIVPDLFMWERWAENEMQAKRTFRYLHNLHYFGYALILGWDNKQAGIPFVDSFNAGLESITLAKAARA